MIEVHCVGHQFWSFNDPRHPLQVADVPDDVRHAMRTVYEATDAQVGRLLEHAGTGATVFLLASHGYQPFVHGPQLLPELLVRLGLRRAPSRLTVAPSYLPSFARAALRAIMPMSLRNRRNPRAGLVPMSFDLASPSNRVAALENNRCGALRINVRGREPYGRVEPGAQVEAIVTRLRAELEALTDPVSGERIVTRVATARLFGPDHHPDLPDVMVAFRDDLGPLETCVGPRVGRDHRAVLSAPTAVPTVGPRTSGARVTMRRRRSCGSPARECTRTVPAGPVEPSTSPRPRSCRCSTSRSRRASTVLAHQPGRRDRPKYRGVVGLALEGAMELVVAIAIAGGLGFWTYSDAKGLDQRGIRVLRWSPAAWGWLVFLFALLFGILYLVNRARAIAAGVPPQPAAEPEPDVPRRFCPKCGTQIVPYAADRHGCGREMERISP